MAKKRVKKLYIVDHANKSADRHCTNPNRTLAKRGQFRRDLEPATAASDTGSRAENGPGHKTDA